MPSFYNQLQGHDAEPMILLQNGQDTEALLPGAIRKSALQFGQVTVTRLIVGAEGVDCDLSVHFIDDVCARAISATD